jgi:hypothetical protein
MLFVYVHISLSAELVLDCVLFITANTLPARGLPRARRSRPPHFFKVFSKNSDNFVETDRTSEKVFNGNSNSQKVKMTTCMG